MRRAPVDVNDASTHSAAYKIFHYYYGWLVPDSETYTVNDTHYFGLSTPLNAKEAEAIASTLQPKHLRIFEVAHFIDGGVKFGLVSPKFSVEIYRIIVEHLNDWITAIDCNEVADEAVPYDGLRQLSDLAAEMFKVATNNGLIDVREAERSPVRRLTSGNMRSNAFKRRQPTHNKSAFRIIEAAHYRATHHGKQPTSVFEMSEDGQMASQDGGNSMTHYDTRSARRPREIR